MYLTIYYVFPFNKQLTYSLLNFTAQMQGAYLVADDIMDHSQTRRGKPCWYKQVHVYPMEWLCEIPFAFK